MTDLRRVLGDRAAAAPVPPADLIDRVERVYRRRRRGRVATAAFAAVLVLVGGTLASLGSFTDRADTPARPVVYAPFRIPDSLDSPPPVEETWPGLLRDDGPDPTVSDAVRARTVGKLDDGHLLLSVDSIFFAYDVTTHISRIQVGGLSEVMAGRRLGPAFLTPQWIVWLADRADGAGGSAVYRVPRTGGTPQLVADNLTGSFGPGGPYATDDFLYWSTAVPGVRRLSLTDGKVSALPGFGAMSVNGSVWAETPAVGADGSAAPPDRGRIRLGIGLYRNLVTGEQRPITDTDPAERLQCLPDWCLGRLVTDPERKFVQRPDGSHRTLLPDHRQEYHAVWAGDDAFLAAGSTLLDPDTGKVGAPPGDLARCGTSWGETGDRLVIGWGGSDGTKTCPPGRIFLTTTD